MELHGREGRGERVAITFSGHFAGRLFLPTLFTPSFPTPLSCTPARPTTSSSPLDFALGCCLSLSLPSPFQLSSSRKPFPLSYTAFLSSFLPSFFTPSLLPPRSFNLRFEDYKSFTSLARSQSRSLARAIFSISPLTFPLPSSLPRAACQLLPPSPRKDGMKAT